MRKKLAIGLALFSVAIAICFWTGFMSVRTLHIGAKDANGKTRLLSVR